MKQRIELNSLIDLSNTTELGWISKVLESYHDSNLLSFYELDDQEVCLDQIIEYLNEYEIYDEERKNRISE